MDSSTDPPPPIVGGKSGNYLQCPFSGCTFYCRYHRIYKSHLEIFHFCTACTKHYANREYHQCEATGQIGGAGNSSNIATDVFKPHTKAHKSTVQTFIHHFDEQQSNFIDPEDKEKMRISPTKAFFVFTPAITKLLKNALEQMGNIKLTFKLCVVMMNEEFGAEGVEEIRHVAYFVNKPPVELHSEHGISEAITTITGDISNQLQDYVTYGSGFRIEKLVSLEIKIYEHMPYRNSRGDGFLKMPFQRRGVVNFRTQQDCFKICVVAGILWNQQKARDSLSRMKTVSYWRRYIPNYNFQGLPNSVGVFEDIQNFEDRNQVAVHVFTHRENQVIKMRQSKAEHTTVVNLFFIRDTTKAGEALGRGHFALITNLNVFLNHGNSHRKFICPHCLKSYNNERYFHRHAGRCKTPADADDYIEEVYPKEGETMHFRRPEMSLESAFSVFYDWETFQVDKNEQKGSATIIKNELVPASFSMVLIANEDGGGKRVARVKYYDGPSLFEEFWRTCFEWSQYAISFVRNTHNAIRATAEEIEKHRKATNCELCKKPFSTPEDVLEGRMTQKQAKAKCKTLHHHHLSSRVIGSVCNSCNIRISFQSELVFVAHNASKFDCRLLTRNLDSPYFDKKDVEIIGKSSEQFTQIKIKGKHHTVPPLFNPTVPSELQSTPLSNETARLRFIDSNLFLLAPLSKLVDSLELDEEFSKFKFVRESFPYMINDEEAEATNEDLKYLLKKMPFAYSFLTPSCINDGVGLPSRSYYYNELTGKSISDEEWQNVQDITSKFNITSFRQLLRQYCILDTVLLACVFEAFRDACMKTYGLDVLQTLSLPNYSWNCYLFHSKVEIDYMRCPQMIKDVENGLRGGFCYATRKIIKTNSERSNEGYDPSKPRSHIVYADVNSLYAHTLCKKFPKRNFKWMSTEKIAATDWASDELGKDSIGYILCVDLKYNHSCHERSKFLPFAPLRRKVAYSELSQNQRDSVDALGSVGRSFLSHEKLILDQQDKKQYVIHYEMLRYYLKNGMSLEKVHRAFEFEEEAYFKEYVERNLKLRQEARDNITSTLCKLSSNSLYGKSIQSNVNHLEIRVCGSREEAVKYINCSRLRDIQIISETCSLVYLVPKKLRRDTVIQAGFSVLELAKLHFYNDYYSKLVPLFQNRASLSYCDTDSCFLYVENDPDNTFLEDLRAGADVFDYSKLDPKTSDLLLKYPELINKNKGEPGYWKLESIDLAACVYLKPKMYCTKHFGGALEKKAKGVREASLQDVIFQTYEETITKKKILKLPLTSFRSEDHRIYTVTTQKLAFTDIDTSRVYPTDDINFSLPFYNHTLYNCNCENNPGNNNNNNSSYDSDETYYDSDETCFEWE